MPLLITVLSSVTIFLLVLALFPPKEDLLHRRLKSYSHHLPQGTRPPLSLPFSSRVVNPILLKLAGVVARVAPKNMQQTARAELEMAASTVSPNTFVTVQLAGVILLPSLYAVPMLLNNRPWTMVNILIVLVLTLIGWRGPKSWLRSKAEGRRKRIERALPDALDLIVVSMEAGLSFDAGLSKVVEKTKGPLRDEFNRVLQEVSLGKLRREALRGLGQRCRVPDLMSFVNSMVQADQMGLSIGQVLRTQADEARLKRRQRAEETAMKAPVKMLLPLLMCIFPAMMIVLLGPAAMAIYDNVIKTMQQ
ncbi:MAG: type II secretion system F family protein [Chloroflexota bacterium]|nr:MAG: type II secretion system F family protein [Chloroflexota bacterium]